MVLCAESFAIPISKNSVYPWEVHGSSLAETWILTEKTSPSVSERVAQRIKDRNRKLVHLCIWKKPHRGKRLARPGARAAGWEARANLLPTAAASRARQPNSRWEKGQGGQGGKVPWAGAVCPWQSCRGAGGAGLVPRRALTAWPRPRRVPAALYALRSGRAGGAESRPPPSPRLPRTISPSPPAALRRAEITAIQLESFGNTTQRAGSCRAITPACACASARPRDRGTRRVEGAERERASLFRDSGTGAALNTRVCCGQESRRLGTVRTSHSSLCSAFEPCSALCFTRGPLKSLWLVHGAPASGRRAAKSLLPLHMRQLFFQG